MFPADEARRAAGSFCRAGGRRRETGRGSNPTEQLEKIEKPVCGPAAD
jgi:hypothetical protein